MRVATRRLPMTAAIGDFIVFLLFPFLGASSHAMGLTPDTFVRTVVPFTTAWIIVGLVTKAFTPGLIRSPQRTLRTIPATWLAAGVIGLILRTLLFDRSFELTFALVSVGVIGVMLVLWRLILASLRR